MAKGRKNTILSKRQIKAILEIAEWTGQGRPYCWMVKTVESLVELGYAQKSEKGGYVLTEAGKQMINTGFTAAE